MKTTVAFILLIIFSAALFLYQLDKVPAGLYADEVSTGYNAYSLLLTGKDEYGKPYPIAFKLLGSYTPPLYTYLTVPSVWLFGLNAFSVRLVSALSAVLLVITFYLLVRGLRISSSRSLPLIASLFFALTPWLIINNRTGHEATLALLLFAAGVFSLWKGLKEQSFLVLGFLTLSASIYTGHTAKFLVPIFSLAYLIVFRKTLFSKSYLKMLVAGIALAFFIQIPNLAIAFTPAFSVKGQLFYSSEVVRQANYATQTIPQSLAIPYFAIREFLSQFFTYFSPRSLFFLPDPDPQRSFPELSAFYPWMVIPYLIGITILIKTRKELSSKFILLLALSTPIPAALTKDPFSTYRALPALIPLMLIISLGINWLKEKLGKAALPLIIIAIIYSLFLLWRSLFVLLPHERAVTWGYGFQALAEEIKKHPDQKIVIDPSRLKPVYIELAYFLPLPPPLLQDSHDLTVRDNYYQHVAFNPPSNLSNIEIRGIIWEKDIYEEKIIVGDEFAVSPVQAEEHALRKIFEIRDPLGKIIFQGFQTDPIEKRLKKPKSHSS